MTDLQLGLFVIIVGVIFIFILYIMIGCFFISKKFICPICDKIFTDEYDYRNHILWHKTQKECKNGD